ncbi:hypothetical protein [Sphingomonas sp. Leaf4]|uniref:hypothetical protein n=1 Tax=Sphingomonas sp. Leaf4 TaxID=2876553 RepID=UPI001E2E67E3|nr:hypothetical protein [Sphingomonas sp. Leaf4]
MTMIELPPRPSPNAATPALVDRGGVMRGASAIRVNRLGNHYRISITYPPLDDEDRARVFVSRLIRAKRMGLRMPYPLLGVDQGRCGWSVVVDGGGQAGDKLKVRGLPRGGVVREGFWMSIEDASGQHYLHNIGAEVMADAAGKATLSVADTLLRRPFADGCRVHIARPMIEGVIDGDELSWELAIDHNTGISFVLEEAA